MSLIRAVSAAMLAMSCTLNSSPALTVSPIDISEQPSLTVYVKEPTEFNIVSETEEPAAEISEPTFPYSDYEVNLLALLTMAEAEGEPEYGQRLVIDTVLNRIDTPGFAKSIEGVIYEKGQFSSMWDGRVQQVSVTDKMVQLVREEMTSRTNYDVVFFRTKRYSSYGTPLFKVGHHYFSAA